jgi:hypothetical protein
MSAFLHQHIKLIDEAIGQLAIKVAAEGVPSQYDQNLKVIKIKPKSFRTAPETDSLIKEVAATHVVSEYGDEYRFGEINAPTLFALIDHVLIN